jgi:SAM-dependent methyltransferase
MSTMIPNRAGKRSHGVRADSSRFIVQSLDEYGLESGLALDIPCGDGRHSRLLASVGMDVISVDLDRHSLLWGGAVNGSGDRVLAICADATRELPFADALFDLALVVHFPLVEVLPPLVRCVKPGGLLILESFGAQGGNWLSLPLLGQIQQMLSSAAFALLRYEEAPVRRHAERVVLKTVARKN